MSRPYNDPDQMLKMSEHPEGLSPDEMRWSANVCLAWTP